MSRAQKTLSMHGLPGSLGGGAGPPPARPAPAPLPGANNNWWCAPFGGNTGAEPVHSTAVVEQLNQTLM